MQAPSKDAKYLMLMLEKVTGRRVFLKEVNDASRHLATEALNALSEALDMCRTNLTTAIEKVKDLGTEDVSLTKLQGLQQMFDANLTEVSEIITSVTGMQTKEDTFAGTPALTESESDEDKGVEMSMDHALKKPQDVKKFTDSNVNVILDDDDSF